VAGKKGYSKIKPMCGGIEYHGDKIYFPNPQARLPVRLHSGNVTWFTWDNRKKEVNRNFPNGGWARLDSIYTGKWKPWHPKPF